MTHTSSLRWLKLPNGKRILQYFEYVGLEGRWFDVPELPYHMLTQEEVDARELWKDEQVKAETKARDQARPGDSG